MENVSTTAEASWWAAKYLGPPQATSTAMGERLLMSGTAIGLGILALVAAIHNHDRYFQLLKVRLIEQTWGRPAARAFYAVVGLLLLSLGAVIAATGR